MQPMVVLAIIAFIFIFFQTVMNLMQYKGIQKQYSEIRGHCHYVSVGQVRKFGRVRISLLGFDKDGLLEECWLLSGLTFFARFKRVHKYEQTQFDELPAMLDIKNKDQACIMQAVDYMKMRMSNEESDAEYFGENDSDEEAEAAPEVITETIE